MKSRMVSFYIDLDALPPLMAAVEDFLARIPLPVVTVDLNATVPMQLCIGKERALPVPSGRSVDNQMTPPRLALVRLVPTPSLHIDLASGLKYRHHLS